MLSNLAANKLLQYNQHPTQAYITPRTLQLIKHRKAMQSNPNVRYEEIQNLQEAIKIHFKQDKQQHILNTVKQELDVREKWAGIRALKSNFNPLPYNRKDK